MTDVLDAITKLVVVSPMDVMQGPLDPGWAGDPLLQDDLDEILTRYPNLVPHAFAVVDLTDDPDPSKTPGFNRLSPAYAGYSDTQQRFIASLAKLLALYGAFSLRAELITLSGAMSITDLATAAAGIRQDYRRMDGATATRPLIEKMFDAPTAPADINFTRSPKSRNDLAALYGQGPIDPDFSRLTMREHLRLMAGWSDNFSASSVIRGLGFDYLWALTIRAGLFRWKWEPVTRNDSQPGDPGGLFLGQDYQGMIWNHRPNWVPQVSNQAGSARSVALLLTMLAQDRLVWDHAGNVGMREMLRKSNDDFTSSENHAEDSPIGVGMTQASPAWHAHQDPWDEDATPIPPPTDPTKDIAASKIGLAGDPASNGLIVRTTRPKLSGGNVTITAVLVGIEASADWTNLNDFGREMALKLDKRHGVT